MVATRYPRPKEYIAAELIITVKPFNWTPLPKARDRMPEIRGGWRYHREHADQAMVNSLRRGNVPSRLGDYPRAGAYEEGSSIFGGWWDNNKIPLHRVIAGLLKLDFGYFGYSGPIRAEYEATEWRRAFPLVLPFPPGNGSTLPISVGQGTEPITVKRTTLLSGVELAWDQFREDLIRFELPAGATPDDEEPSANRRSGSRRKGRVANPVWEAARAVAMQWLDENGYPQPGDGGQARLEKHITDWLDARGRLPAESTVRTHVVRWISDYRANLPPDHSDPP